MEKKPTRLPEESASDPSGEAHDHSKNRWLKKILLIAVTLLLTLAVSAVAWKLGWLVQSPTSIFKSSLAKANIGQYEEATENLPTGGREVFHKDPKMMKIVWDKVTRNGTIHSVEISKEDRGLTGTFGDIDFVITYKDGSKIAGQEKISYYNNRWSHGIMDFYKMIMEKEKQAAFEALTVTLSKDYTRVRDNAVALRLPEGCVWDPREKAYDHPKLRILISVDSPLFASFSSLVKKVEGEWSRPDTTFLHRRDIDRQNVKALLFEGIRMNAQGGRWRLMYLVIGQENRAVLVTAILPEHDNLTPVLRECLTSFRWEP